MKKILTIVAALLALSGPAAAKPEQKPDSISISASFSGDSVRNIQADISLHSDSASSEALQGAARLVTTDGGDTYILTEGKAYPLCDLISEAETPDRLLTTEDVADQKLREIGTWGVLGILAICFGFPALVVIIAIVLIIGFFRNRNRERNAIIAQAIDRDYQLPDTFYTNQPQHDTAENGNPANSEPLRDPELFKSAVTLIAVGLAVGVFFLAVDAPFGIVAGGIPLLLGIGRLIGYFFIPGYKTAKPGKGRHYYNNQGQNGYGNSQNGTACPPPPPGERFYYDPRDPRYNGKA